jgi:hypothetical protein
VPARKERKELRFHIHEYTPHTLPMERLAEYLKNLAVLLGSTQDVHFIRLEAGSLSCTLETEATEEPNIVNRVQSVKIGNGTEEAIRAYAKLRELLQKDEASAELEVESGDVILDFPRIKTGEQEIFGPFWQDGSVDGILVKIGGIDATVPVHLVDEGAYHICNASRELAKDLAPHLFSTPIRVHGRGRWIRNTDSKWEMQWFDIHRFEKLETVNLNEAVSRLRAIPDNDLMSLKDPLGEMRKVRHGDDL